MLLQRIFAEIDSGKPGPLVIVVAALHGNEHVGFHSVRAVVQELQTNDFIGKVVGVTGNLTAADEKQRYLERDLNRFFISEYLEEDHLGVSEWHEAHGLIDAILELKDTWFADREVHLLDMHSMSGDGTPFTCFPHTDMNEKLAHELPLPALADIIEFLPGTLVDYFSDKLSSTMVVESGQHEADITKHVGKAALTCFLYLTGCLKSESLYQKADTFLKDYTQGSHKIFTRVKYRYHIERQGYFDMCPGYQNLQPVPASELLAKDQGQQVLAPFTGRVVLPCYQKQGNDGFFISIDE